MQRWTRTSQTSTGNNNNLTTVFNCIPHSSQQVELLEARLLELFVKLLIVSEKHCNYCTLLLVTDFLWRVAD